MIDIKQAEIPIDDTITVLRRYVQGGDVYNSMMSVGRLAELIDRHRQICKNEIEGLKGDVKSAEANYEISEKSHKQHRAEWTKALVDQKIISQDLEDNAVNLRGQIAFLKQWVQDLQAAQKVEYSVAMPDLETIQPPADRITGASLRTDPGAPEGDKTVITFECCNVKHFFTPPKGGSWQHIAECHECGSKTSFGIS